MRRKAEIERKKSELISELKDYERTLDSVREELRNHYKKLIRDLNNQIKALDWVLELI